MADSVTITAGAAATPPDGTKILGDLVTGTGEFIQGFKLVYSANGVDTFVPADGSGMAVNVLAGTVTATGSLSPAAATTGGATPYWNSGLTNTRVAMKAAPGTLYGWHITNLTSADLWVKFWDLASGSVTVGTTEATFGIGVPGSSANHTGTASGTTAGIAFATAITIAAVTGPTATGTGSNTSPGASVCQVALFYK